MNKTLVANHMSHGRCWKHSTFDIKLSIIFSNICDRCLRPSTQINCLCLGPKEFICSEGHIYLWCHLHQKQIELPYQGYSHKLKWWTFKDVYRGECLCLPIGLKCREPRFPCHPSSSVLMEKL